MGRIGTHWRWLRRALSRVAGYHKSTASPRLDAGNEPFEIALLFGTEVARHLNVSRRLLESERGAEGEHVAQLRDVGARANKIEVPRTIHGIAKQHSAS